MWFDTYSAAKWRQVYHWPPDRRLFLLGDVPRKLPIENTRVHKTFIVVITICFGGKYVFGNILAMLIENEFLFSKKCFFWDNEQMKIENPSLFYSVTKATGVYISVLFACKCTRTIEKIYPNEAYWELCLNLKLTILYSNVEILD